MLTQSTGGGSGAENQAGFGASLSAPHSSDPCNTRTVVWGTTVNIVESMAMFKNFLYYFKPGDNPSSDLVQMQFESCYCQKLKGVRGINIKFFTEAA